MSNLHIRSREYGPRFADSLDAAALERYLAVLIRAARRGGFKAAESELMEWMAGYLGAPPDLQERARQLADKEGEDLWALAGGFEDRAVRLCLLRDVCRMASADGQVDLAEQEFVTDLIYALDIPPDVAGEVGDLVEGQWRAQQRFLDLVDQR